MAWTRRIGLTLILSYGFSLLAALSFLFMVLLFLWQSVPVWHHEGLSYLFGKEWFYRGRHFGILPMIYGTGVVAGLALLLAAPIGIGTAIFTAEFLPPRARLTVKIAVELLSGIPSVVYGLLGILFLRDWVYQAFAPFDPLTGDTLLTAAILLAVMVLPTIMTLADDALRGVPSQHRLAARGLGLNPTEALLSVALPQAAPGIVSAVLLGFGRAIGETIAVFLVVGRQDNHWPSSLLSLSPLLEPGQTLTSKLGGSEINIAYGDPLHWAAMVGLGLVLMLITSGITLLGVRLGRGRGAGA